MRRIFIIFYTFIVHIGERMLYFTEKFAINFIMFRDKLKILGNLSNILYILDNDRNFWNIKKTFYKLYNKIYEIVNCNKLA